MPRGLYRCSIVRSCGRSNMPLGLGIGQCVITPGINTWHIIVPARMKSLLQRLIDTVRGALSDEPTYDAFGPTLAALMSAFTFTFFISWIAAEFARRWQTSEITPGQNVLVQFPGRALFSLSIVAFWVFGLARFFRIIKWPTWWAVPYVLLILCPWTWVFAGKIGVGGDLVCLTLLQSPVTIVYVLRMRKFYGEEKSNRT